MERGVFVADTAGGDMDVSACPAGDSGGTETPADGTSSVCSSFSVGPGSNIVSVVMVL